MVTFNSVAAFDNALLRKALVGAVLVADYGTAALTEICSGTGTSAALVALTGYESLGKLSSDGVTVSASQDVSEIRGWGDVSSPSRIDVTGGSSSMTLTALESKRAVWDAFHGVDLAAVAPLSTGTVTFDKPAVPVLRDKRVLFLARDIEKASGFDVFIGVHFLRANISNNGDQTYANTDTTINYPLTISALVDDVEGTAVRLFYGGPGSAGLNTAMGF